VARRKAIHYLIQSTRRPGFLPADLQHCDPAQPPKEAIESGRRKANETAQTATTDWSDGTLPSTVF
jgi:hypothetical protein